MNHFTRVVLTGLMVCCVFAVKLSAVESSSLVTNTPSDGNAAIQYWTVFDSAFRWNKKFSWLNNMDSNWSAPANSEAEQADSRALQYLHLGAGLPGGSFESLVSVRELGGEALLPQIGHVRDLARLALARACWRFQHQQAQLAIADCLAVLSLGSDLSNKGCLIEVLTAGSIQSQTFVLLGVYLPTCTEDERVKLANLIESPRYALHINGVVPHITLMHEKLKAGIREGKDVTNLLFAGLSGNELESMQNMIDSVKNMIANKDPQIITWINEVEFYCKSIIPAINLPEVRFNEEVKTISAQVSKQNPLLLMGGGRFLNRACCLHCGLAFVSLTRCAHSCDMPLCNLASPADSHRLQA